MESPFLDDFQTLSITVGEVNVAPVLDPIGNQLLYEGDTLTFTATASDADLPANNLTFSLDAGASRRNDRSPSPASSTGRRERKVTRSTSVTVRVTDNG